MEVFLIISMNNFTSEPPSLVLSDFYLYLANREI